MGVVVALNCHERKETHLIQHIIGICKVLLLAQVSQVNGGHRTNRLGEGGVYILVDVFLFDLVSKPGHWAIRPILAEFAATRNYHSQRVIKISREENKIADTLAKRAFWNRMDSTTSFLCTKHVPSLSMCPVRDALQNLNLPFGRLQSVLCSAC